MEGMSEWVNGCGGEGKERTVGGVVDRDPIRPWSHFGITADAGGSDAGVRERSDGELAFDFCEVGDIHLIVVVLYPFRY